MASRQRIWIATSLAALTLIAAGVVFAPQIYVRLELAPLRYDVIGVDVSHHQGQIDWRALAGDGIAFAYIKATEGGNFRDTNFASNWAGAAGAGLVRGAYHFFTPCRTGIDQARNFIATVPRDPSALPPAVDAESMGPCSNGAPIGNVAGELGSGSAASSGHRSFGRSNGFCGSIRIAEPGAACRALLTCPRSAARSRISRRSCNRTLKDQEVMRPWSAWSGT